MDRDTRGTIRDIFQHKLQLHPYWNKEERQALAKLLDLSEQELDALHQLSNWIGGHGLEHAFLLKDKAR